MTDQDAVAVIGMSGRFPGAPDLDAYWSDLRAGRCRIAALDEAELLADGADPAELARPDYVRAKGVLDDADRFEAEGELPFHLVGNLGRHRCRRVRRSAPTGLRCSRPRRRCRRPQR